MKRIFALNTCYNKLMKVDFEKAYDLLGETSYII